jgi:HK97 family phage prohead protease
MNQNIEFKAIPGQFNIDEAQGIVECFVAGIGNKDSVGDVLVSGAFTKSLTRRKPRVVWGHNWNDPIGKVIEIYEVAPGDRRLPMKMLNAGIGGLYARVQFNLNSEKGREAFANVAFFGQEQEWSIGYKTLDSIFDPSMQANILKEVELYEVSPVLHGANQLTGTISVKSDGTGEDAKGGMMMVGPMAGRPSGMMPHAHHRPTPNILEANKPGIGDERKNQLEIELALRAGAPVKVRLAEENTVIFDRMTPDGAPTTYRVSYHFTGKEFMFGKPEKVSVQTVYVPSSEESGSRVVVPSQMPSMPMYVKPQGNAYMGDDQNEYQGIMPKSYDDGEKWVFDDELADLANIISDSLDVKVGRALSSKNMSKLKAILENLQDVIASAEKDVESKSDYVIPVNIENAFETKQLLDPIFDYHRVESHVTEDGIVVTSGVTDEFVEALGVAEKALGQRLGGGLGKLGRAARGAANFDPNAWDGDGDGLVQEGTPYQRPAIPGVNDRSTGGRVDAAAATRAFRQQGGKPDSSDSKKPSDKKPSAKKPSARGLASSGKPDPIKREGEFHGGNIYDEFNGSYVEGEVIALSDLYGDDRPGYAVVGRYDSDGSGTIDYFYGGDDEEFETIEDAIAFLENVENEAENDRFYNDSNFRSLDRVRSAGRPGQRPLAGLASTAEIVSKDDLPKNIVTDLSNAAVRAVGDNGDETKLIDGVKEVLANLTDEKLKDSVGTSMSNARKKLAEMLSDENIIEEFKSREAIDDFMDEVGYSVQRMLDSHLYSVKKTGNSVEKEEIDEIVDNAKSKFDDDFNKLVKASREFWNKRRKPGRLDDTPEEAKKTAAKDRKNLMDSLREGGEPEDLEATLGSISDLWKDSSEGITSGTISLEDLNYEIEKAIDQIVENDPSIDPEELVNEFADALREGASKDGANPLIVSLAKEFGDEKITGGDLINALNDTRQNSVYRPDRGKIEKEKIRGLASSSDRRMRDDDNFDEYDEAFGPSSRGSRRGMADDPVGDAAAENIDRGRTAGAVRRGLASRGDGKPVLGRDISYFNPPDDSNEIEWEYALEEAKDLTRKEIERDWSELRNDIMRDEVRAAITGESLTPGQKHIQDQILNNFDELLESSSLYNDEDELMGEMRRIAALPRDERLNALKKYTKEPKDFRERQNLDARISLISDGFLSDYEDDKDNPFFKELDKSVRESIAESIYDDRVNFDPRDEYGYDGLASSSSSNRTMLNRPGQIQRDERGNVDPTEAREARAAFDQNIFKKLQDLGFNDDEIEQLTGVPDGGRIREGGKPAQYVPDNVGRGGLASESRVPGKLSENTELQRVTRAISEDGTTVLDSQILKEFLSGMSAEEIDKRHRLGGKRNANASANREIRRIRANLNSQANSDMDLLIYRESGLGVNEAAELFNISPREVRKREKRLRAKLAKNTDDEDLLYLRSALTLEETGRILGLKPTDVRRQEQEALRGVREGIKKREAEGLKRREGRGGLASESREMDMTLDEYAKLNSVLSKYTDDSQASGIGADEDMQILQDILDKIDNSSAANDAVSMTDSEIDDYIDTLTRMKDNGPVEDQGDKAEIEKLIDSLKKTKKSATGSYSSDALEEAGTRLSSPGSNASRSAKPVKKTRAFRTSGGTINPHEKLRIELSRDEIGALRDEVEMLTRTAEDPSALRSLARKLEKANNGKFTIEKDEYEDLVKSIEQSKSKGGVVSSDILGVLEQASETSDGKFSSLNLRGGGLASSNGGKRPNNGAPPDITEAMQKEYIFWGKSGKANNLRLVQEAIREYDANGGQLPPAKWKRLQTMYKNMGPGSASGRGGRRGLTGNTSGAGRRGRVGLASSGGEEAMGRERGPGVSAGGLGDIGMRADAEGSFGVGRGGADMTSGGGGVNQKKFEGLSFDEAKPANWDELTNEEKFDWLMYEGAPEKVADKDQRMSQAAHEGAVKKVLMDIDREERRSMTPQQRREARDAEKVNVSERELERQRLEREKREKEKAKEKTPKKYTPAPNAEEGKKKRAIDFDSFKEWIADTGIMLNDIDEGQDYDPIAEDIWNTVDALLGEGDMTMRSIDDTIDALEDYLEGASATNKYEKKSVSRAEKLLSELKKARTKYEGDPWIVDDRPRGGLASRSRYVNPNRPGPNNREMPQSNAKREGEMKRLIDLAQQVIDEMKSKQNSNNGRRARVGLASSSSRPKAMITDEATFFKDIETSLQKEIRAAQKANNKKAENGLSKLQEVIRRNEASKTGSRRTNVGSIYLTDDEADLVLEGLMFALDNQIEIGGDKRIEWYSKLLDKVSQAAMSTFINKNF